MSPSASPPPLLAEFDPGAVGLGVVVVGVVEGVLDDTAPNEFKAQGIAIESL